MLNGEVIEQTDQVKYLGFIINDDFSVDCDIQREVRAVYIRGNMILKYFRH